MTQEEHLDAIEQVLPPATQSAVPSYWASRMDALLLRRRRANYLRWREKANVAAGWVMKSARHRRLKKWLRAFARADARARKIFARQKEQETCPFMAASLYREQKQSTPLQTI